MTDNTDVVSFDSITYYVDKSLLIKEIMDRDDQIILITRPRRFGKTMNMSMLKYFFEKPECRKAYFEDVIEFMKSMLVKGFKDNNSLKKGVLTGIMKVAKAVFANI